MFCQSSVQLVVVLWEPSIGAFTPKCQAGTGDVLKEAYLFFPFCSPETFFGQLASSMGALSFPCLVDEMQKKGLCVVDGCRGKL